MRISTPPSLRVEDYPFSHRIRVRFAETDAMSIVHHSSYVLYLEEARVAYLRHIGHPYSDVRATDGDTAVIEVFVQYRKPLLFDELVDVHAALTSVRAATFQMAYLLTVDGDVRATAVTAHGALDRSGRPTRLPAWLTNDARAGRPLRG